MKLLISRNQKDILFVLNDITYEIEQHVVREDALGMRETRNHVVISCKQYGGARLAAGRIKESFTRPGRPSERKISKPSGSGGYPLVSTPPTTLL